jgi:DNA-binding MarR family transcriptional regulator
MEQTEAPERVEDGDDAVEHMESGRTLGEIGLQRFAPYLMNRIMGRYNQALREDLTAANITTPKMRALAVLSINDGLRINELAVYAVVEQSTLSRALDQMESEGLIRRENAADDNRVRNIFITDEGRQRFSGVWPTMLAAYEAMFVGIDPSEREVFIATLHKILRNIRRHDF